MYKFNSRGVLIVVRTPLGVYGRDDEIYYWRRQRINEIPWTCDWGASTVAHFARKVRATNTSRKMFVVAPRRPPKKSSPSLCEQSELQCWRRKNSINSNLRRPRCPNPRFQPSKIAKRLVRNCRAKKCCIFSLKCLDVNNLIHNFVTQDRPHLGILIAASQL